MTESEWLTCADPVAMLAWMAAPQPVSPAGSQVFPPPNVEISSRKWRLYACAAFRATGGGSWNADSAWGLATAESHADGGVSDEELLEAHASFSQELVAEYLLLRDASDAAFSLTRHRFPEGSADAIGVADSWEVADIIRDIVGNPFRPVELSLCEGCYGREDHGPSGNANWKRSECPCCGGVGRIAPWLTPAVLSLAQAAYDTRQPDGTLNPLRLAVLADALEDAGCEGDKCDACRDGYQTAGQSVYPCRRCMGSRTLDHPILAHLRTPGPHWRGCWAVDLILGKE